ncbi:MAG: GNAT family N-acetyltransferase [Solirubrobacteraceae bacterium]
MTRTGAAVIRELAAGELHRVRSLWLDLHTHHLAVDPSIRPGVPPDESWARRAAQYAAWLAQPGAFALVAERDGGTAGYAVVSIGPPDDTYLAGRVMAHLESLSVAPAARGAGVGGALLEAVRARLGTLGAEMLFVSAFAANAGARRFYLSHGFTATQVLYAGPVAAPTPRPARPPAAVEVRDAAPGDEAAVAALLAELGAAVGPAEAARRLAAVQAAPGHAALVAVADGAVAGLAALAATLRLEDGRPSCRLTALAVAPEWRERGVARALLAAAEDWARGQGAGRLEVTSSGDRPAAHAAYRAWGFEPRPERFVKAL